MSMNFVSESSIEDAKKKRQEEWDRVRKPSDPVEAPEQEYDPRTLYERLQEQKNRKKEEQEEAKKLKNCIKGLEDDEVEFLQNVNVTRSVLETQKYEEEMDAIEEYKKSKSSSHTEEQDLKILEAKRQVLGISGTLTTKDTKNGAEIDTQPTNKPMSQAAKLSKLIKRRIPDQESPTESVKKIKSQESPVEKVNILSSIVAYSDDSDSE